MTKKEGERRLSILRLFSDTFLTIYSKEFFVASMVCSKSDVILILERETHKRIHSREKKKESGEESARQKTEKFHSVGQANTIAKERAGNVTDK